MPERIKWRTVQNRVLSFFRENDLSLQHLSWLTSRLPRLVSLLVKYCHDIINNYEESQTETTRKIYYYTYLFIMKRMIQWRYPVILQITASVS